ESRHVPCIVAAQKEVCCPCYAPKDSGIFPESASRFGKRDGDEPGRACRGAGRGRLFSWRAVRLFVALPLVSALGHLAAQRDPARRVFAHAHPDVVANTSGGPACPCDCGVSEWRRFLDNHGTLCHQLRPGVAWRGWYTLCVWRVSSPGYSAAHCGIWPVRGLRRSVSCFFSGYRRRDAHPLGDAQSVRIALGGAVCLERIDD